MVKRGAVPVGPFRLADALGLDVVSDVAATLTGSYGERFKRGQPLLDLVAAGHLGVKTGRGFFSYSSREREPASSGPEDVQDQDLVRRFQLAAFHEAALLFEENIASSRDIDLSLRVGAGWPAGPLEWADRQGLDAVEDALGTLEQRFGPRFSPPASLTRLVRQGRVGVSVGRGYRVYQEAKS